MRILTCIFLGLLALLLPLVIRSNYWLYMFTLVGIYIILVASLDLIYGYTGLVSLGHAAFFGIGAYASGILQTKLGFSFLPALILGSLFTCSVAAVLGWPMLRIKGPYFALGTLALGLMVTIVIHNWDSLTGGVSLSGIPLPPSIQLLDWTIDFSSKRTYYYFVFLFVFLALFFIRQITRSRPGRAFQSIRENADLAEALGVETLRYKLIAYVMASTMAGVAGGLYASYMGSIEPEIAGGHMSFHLLVMIVIGGARTITGEIAGPLLLWFLPEFLEAAQVYRPLFFGFILLVVIIFMPMGIAGKLRSLHPRVAKWIP
ncbi:MAG: branched-chain amino acid transporter permease [Deltaproteobacteria bacterium]|nr:branched-chain amino acid transporter permease [Deltaproteobacteria bacterium]